MWVRISFNFEPFEIQFLFLFNPLGHYVSHIRTDGGYWCANDQMDLQRSNYESVEKSNLFILKRLSIDEDMYSWFFIFPWMIIILQTELLQTYEKNRMQNKVLSSVMNWWG